MIHTDTWATFRRLQTFLLILPAWQDVPKLEREYYETACHYSYTSGKKSPGPFTVGL